MNDAEQRDAQAGQVGADGWWPQAIRYDSPHYDSRPDPADISLLVIHNISLPSGRYGTPHVSDLFTGRVDYNADPALEGLRGLRVSSHFFIRRNGRVLQYVSANDRAWHAGLSSFCGRDKCNDFAIGIELEGTDTEPFESRQYEALAALTAALAERYPLADVQGHEHIAPGRKTDPGPCFDWQKYHALWAALLKKKAALEPALQSTSMAALVPASAVLRFPKGVLQSQ